MLREMQRLVYIYSGTSSNGHSEEGTRMEKLCMCVRNSE